MKAKLTWLIIGFVASWLAWSAIYAVRRQPHDLSAKSPSNVQRLIGETLPWLRSAVMSKAGSYIICAATPPDASATFSPAGKSVPNVLMSDTNQDGFVDSIVLSAAKGQSISAEINPDGSISKYIVSTGDLHDSNSVSVVDADMNGAFDFKVGPGRHSYLWVNSDWRERISTNGMHYVVLDGVETEVELSNGVWNVKR